MLVLYNTRRLSNNPAEKSFGWVRAAVDCDGLAYESARQAQRSRARTSGEQHRQVRTANKTVGLKDRRATPPGVRIPPHPPGIIKTPTKSVGALFLGGFQPLSHHKVTSMCNEVIK